ncbi:unnamed protein product, partial [Sphacelaria rigidula]
MSRQSTINAGRCLEEGGDPQSHLAALDPILAGLDELSSRLRKLPAADIDDSKAIRKELKKKQEAPVLQAMEKEMMKPTPDMGTLRSLIAMATDEVGVEIGTDIVARCKDSLEEAE